MKEFLENTFDFAACRKQVEELGELLRSKSELSERDEILPFFRKRQQLSAYIGTYVPDVGLADRLAYEFQLGGDFSADLVVGSSGRQAYCLVEFENARDDSIFSRTGSKATKEWGRRFEHGFSQVVDWYYHVDDQRGTRRFVRDFGHGEVRFSGLLIIGRSQFLDEHDRGRLRWRASKILVNSQHIVCLTFDDLYEDLWERLTYYPGAATVE